MDKKCRIELVSGVKAGVVEKREEVAVGFLGD